MAAITEEDRKKEARTLVDHISLLCEYWTDLPTGPDGKPADLPTDPEELRKAIRWRVGGIAHSILTIIDGGASTGPYHLIPVEKVEKAKTALDVLEWDLTGQEQLHELFGDVERERAKPEEKK